MFLAFQAGCLGVFADDGGSASVGFHGQGALLRGVEVPVSGKGYRVPTALLDREARFATAELGALVQRAFAAVATRFPASVGALGDLSRRGGGEAPAHGSHESGRDVDIIFYGVDDRGVPYFPDEAMIRYGASGKAIAWSPPQGVPFAPRALPPVHFDARRNWALVRALLSDPTAEVQWIFIHRTLAARLLAEARASGDDGALIARAEALFRQPGDAEPHDDHMHVRVFCDPGDRTRGCIDRGPQRWLKKRWKYMPPGDGRFVPPLVAAAAAADRS